MRSNKLKFLFFVLFIAALPFAGKYFNINIDDTKGFLAGFPLWQSGLIFVALYVIVTFFIWFAKDIFRIASAVLFGPAVSTLFVFVSEAVNSIVLFHFSRFLGRGFVEESLKGKSKGLDEKISKAGLGWLFVFRGVPLIPFRFMDMAAGLTNMPFRKYFLVVIVASPLRIFWLQFILSAVGNAALTNLKVTSRYLVANKPVFIFTFVYLLLMILVAVKLKE
jgi:uncharacterized membrane protein YdjX (TVP38/TMEM64 family)